MQFGLALFDFRQATLTCWQNLNSTGIWEDLNVLGWDCLRHCPACMSIRCIQQEKMMNPVRIAAFTLIETIIVISIVSSVVLCVPPMLQWLRQQGVGHAASQLQADLQLARITAIRQRQTCALSFNTPGLNQYINSHTKRCCDLENFRGNVHFLKQGPDGKKMAAAVNFNRQGMSTTVIPSNIYVSDGDGTLIYRIQVLLPGGISVTRWISGGWH
jgi:type II secretory pathway pseudopilin PulG